MSHTRTARESIRPAQRSTWQLSLLVVLVAVAIGGPAACVVHCLVHPATTHQGQLATDHVHHAAEHADHTGMSHSAADIPEQHQHPTAEDAPSALTIAVVLTLTLLPLLLVISLLSPPRLPALRNVTLPPARDPPRLLLAH